MLDHKFDNQALWWRSHLEAERLAPRTVSFYCETMHCVAEILNRCGRPYMPLEITPEDVRFLLDYMAVDNYAVQTRKGYLACLRRWCHDGGNKTMADWPKPRFPADNRPRVDWLTLEQASRLLSYPLTPIQNVVINLELREGLRHVEVIRLKTSDIDFENHLIKVIGKGPIGGKPRTIPLVPECEAALRAWGAVRQVWVERGRKRYPTSFEDPENFIVWERLGRLYPYSEEGYGLDKVVTLPLSDQLGFRFSNHTLRRTFGRAMYRAGVEVATIAKILGHESTEVTLKYIGVDLDDMRGAMSIDLFRTPKKAEVNP